MKYHEIHFFIVNLFCTGSERGIEDGGRGDVPVPAGRAARRRVRARAPSHARAPQGAGRQVCT